MSHEDDVRLRHAQRRGIKAYFDYLSVLTDDELEIAGGRLADLRESSHSNEDRVRDALLSHYIESRSLGRVKRKRFGRMFVVSRVYEQAVRHLMHAESWPRVIAEERVCRDDAVIEHSAKLGLGTALANASTENVASLLSGK